MRVQGALTQGLNKKTREKGFETTFKTLEWSEVKKKKKRAMKVSGKMCEMIRAEYKEDVHFCLFFFSFCWCNLGYLGSNSFFTIYYLGDHEQMI